jgi:hypothetical protein
MVFFGSAVIGHGEIFTTLILFEGKSLIIKYPAVCLFYEEPNGIFWTAGRNLFETILIKELQKGTK